MVLTRRIRSVLGLAVVAGSLIGVSDAYCVVEAPDMDGYILTPPVSKRPRVNGPSIFGARSGAPFLYAIPASGLRPMTFSVENLPTGLAVDAKTGRITGSLRVNGTYEVTLGAHNELGSSTKKFRIVIGEKISLTPAMGWNSWNSWAATVDQEKVLRSARALVSSGLANHGWSYINIDDGWQGLRSSRDGALTANEKFPDIKALCDEIHELGLKVGIYSTPWITSYAGFAGGSSDLADGTWSKALAPSSVGHRIGRYSFAVVDARQWAAWGVDYLKYDWKPNDVPHTEEMSAALRSSGRDIIFSISNTAPFEYATDWARLTNSWRTTGDIWDRWAITDKSWQFGVSEIGFSQERWLPYAGPGHWNDPDMLVVGYIGWGPDLRPTTLTASEQYSHVSLWCLLAAPLLIGCDLERLDAFTLSLLTNDEVIAINQDALGRQAQRVATMGAIDVYVKELEDGGKAVGFFNRDSNEQSVTYNKLGYLGLGAKVHVRDLWRQIDLPDLRPNRDTLKIVIPAHGVLLYKITTAN